MKNCLEAVDFISFEDLRLSLVEITLKLRLSLLNIHLEERNLLVKTFDLVLESLGRVFSCSKLGHLSLLSRFSLF